MNSKTVLNKILAALSLVNEPVEFTDAKDAQGQILQSPTFDLGETVEVISEDGTKTPAPDGEHEIALRDTEGNEVVIRIVTQDGKITERENVEEAQPETETEMAAEDTDMVPVDEIPQQTQEDEVNVPQTVNGDIKSGTIKAASEKPLFVSGAEGSAKDAEVTEDPSEGEVPEQAKDKEQGVLEALTALSYRIDEMEKTIAKYEAMNPPVDSEVTEEEAGVKMSAEPDEEEELPKLDGAPMEENKNQNFSENRKNYGKKNADSQSSFLSKLYK
jgi:hypothetical protein